MFVTVSLPPKAKLWRLVGCLVAQKWRHVSIQLRYLACWKTWGSTWTEKVNVEHRWGPKIYFRCRLWIARRKPKDLKRATQCMPLGLTLLNHSPNKIKAPQKTKNSTKKILRLRRYSHMWSIQLIALSWRTNRVQKSLLLIHRPWKLSFRSASVSQLNKAKSWGIRDIDKQISKKWKIVEIFWKMKNSRHKFRKCDKSWARSTQRISGSSGRIHISMRTEWHIYFTKIQIKS